MPQEQQAPAKRGCRGLKEPRATPKRATPTVWTVLKSPCGYAGWGCVPCSGALVISGQRSFMVASVCMRQCPRWCWPAWVAQPYVLTLPERAAPGASSPVASSPGAFTVLLWGFTPSWPPWIYPQPVASQTWPWLTLHEPQLTRTHRWPLAACRLQCQF